MRARVEEDVISRQIVIGVEDAPDLDVSEPWNARPRIIRPDRLVIEIVDREQRCATVSGYLVLQSGKTSSGVRVEFDWQKWGGRRHKIESAPDWVKALCTDAPSNVTEWPVRG